MLMKKPYSFPVDIWGLGLIIGSMMFLDAPIDLELIKTSKDAQIDFIITETDDGKFKYKDGRPLEHRYIVLFMLVKSMLERQPERRPKIELVIKILHQLEERYEKDRFGSGNAFAMRLCSACF